MPRYTPEEYLEMERKAEFKSEYLDGAIFGMVGASEPHNLIVANVLARIHWQLLNSPCRVYSNDMRVDIREHGMFAYPDVVALCDKPVFSCERKDNLLNPALIVEVLSKSTEGYDRGEKFVRYRRIESLVDYVLTAQDRHHLEHYVRQDRGWLFTETNSLEDSIHLSSINCDLPVKEIYDKVDMAAQ